MDRRAVAYRCALTDRCRREVPRRVARLVSAAVRLYLASPAAAHEPIFGLGPHVTFKNGIGIEAELELERAGGSGEKERDAAVRTELIYGLTEDLSATLAVPVIIDRRRESRSGADSGRGLGDVTVRANDRIWRRDRPGLQDAAAILLGVKLPAASEAGSVPLGSGSTDDLAGLALARESRRSYAFGDPRLRWNTERSGGRAAGNRFSGDVAGGIRPWLAEYFQPDLVVLLELNWESHGTDRSEGRRIDDSGGDPIFLSPGIFFTYRNIAIKTGLQYPFYMSLRGDRPEKDDRFAFAVRPHI